MLPSPLTIRSSNQHEICDHIWAANKLSPSQRNSPYKLSKSQTPPVIQISLLKSGQFLPKSFLEQRENLHWIRSKMLNLVNSDFRCLTLWVWCVWSGIDSRRDFIRFEKMDFKYFGLGFKVGLVGFLNRFRVDQVDHAGAKFALKIAWNY